MTDVVVLVVLAVILSVAGGYVYRAKKHGAKCIGCPVQGGCSETCACHKDM